MSLRRLLEPAVAVLVLGTWTAACAETLVLDTGKSTKNFDVRNDNGSASFGTEVGGATYGRGKWEQDRVDHSPNRVKLMAAVPKDKVNYEKELVTLKHDDLPIIVMQADGNLCVYSDQPKHKGLIWQSGTKGPGCRLLLQDDGYLVIRGAGNRVLWRAVKVRPGSML